MRQLQTESRKVGKSESERRGAGCPFPPFRRPDRLLQDFRDHARAHRPPTLADRKPQPLVHRDRRDQLDRHLDVVPRHHHLHPRRQFHRPRHVRRPEVELRPVPLEERRVPPPLFLRQHVHLGLELRVRRDAPPPPPHHPPPHPLPPPPPPPTPPPPP